MGVTGLWNIVTPLSKVSSLAELRGKTVAIDLSGWIVDSKTVGTNDGCPNIHLRNIFFRTTALLMNGINPVFVLEGKAPELKHDIIRERNNARKDFNHASQAKRAKGGRGNSFKATAKQCEMMLKLMGLTCVQAEGEAEAMCAYMDADGLVDGCISQDSDCFLYGAKKVYRNFTLHDKTGFGSSVEEYTLESIERIYGLGRNKMIALALLCGCDYDTGVPGVGKERALQLLRANDDENILKKFNSWRSDKSVVDTKNTRIKGNISDEEKKIIANELLIKRKCVVVENFPNQELIDEFVTRKGSVPKKIKKWQQPNIIELIQFMERKIQWSAEYALEKIFPLLPRWQLENMSLNLPIHAVEPKQIIKKRNIQSISYFEIEWNVNAKSYIDPTDNDNEEYDYDKNLCSIEPQELVRHAYPEFVQSYEDEKDAKKKRGKRKPVEKLNSNNDENKTKTRRPAKKLESNKKIDEFIQTNVINLEEKSQKKNPVSKKQSSRKRSLPKLDYTVSHLLNDLGEDDFMTDVEDDDLEMSMIVARVCGRSEKSKTPLKQKNPTISPKVSSSINELPKKNVTIETEKIVINSDEDSDDDIPYVPLNLRIRK